MTTTTTERYEHRAIEDHNCGPWYGGDYIIKAGTLLEKTKTPHKRRDYAVCQGHGVYMAIPAEKVGVYKITRTVTETTQLL